MCSKVFDKLNALLLLLPELNVPVTTCRNYEVCPANCRQELQVTTVNYIIAHYMYNIAYL